MSQSRNATRRDFLKSFAAATATLAVAPDLGRFLRNDRSANRPNIVLVFTDDLGYADVGCYGAKGFETPILDHMASQGMRFTDFYVSQAVCSASRASLLTGCYSERVSIQGALGPWAEIGLNPEEETIARMLKRQGYATAIFGKWHLGHHKEFLPLSHGFDEYFGLPYSNDMWPFGYDGKPPADRRKAGYPSLPLIDGYEKVGEIRNLQDQASLTTRYTERAVRFIEKNKNRPFFLYLPHSMPHTPIAASTKFRGKSERGLYGDVIMEIDWSVGEIVKTLRTHGLESDTLMIFTSDNGPWLNFGDYGGSALPLREGKGTMFEGGCRVPCIMQWPGHIPAGIECHETAATIDILPTIAAVTGAPLPQKPIDGVNILPLLEGEANAKPRDHYFFYYDRQLRAVRRGEWKLFFPHTSRSYLGVKPGKDGQPGPYAQVNVGLELYDLKNDLSETRNVAERHPEIVTELQQLAETAREELGDALTGRKGKGVRLPGRRSWSRPERVSHLAAGATITFEHAPSARYPGTNDTLVDGLRGSRDFTDGRWQGFEGDDLVAVIDLGKVVPIQDVACGFLQNQTSWIFFPTAVEIALSRDGRTFELADRLQIKTEADLEPRVEDYSMQLKSTPARYVRVRAINVGTCPQGHLGAGGKAWLFADEIIVR